MFSLLPSGKTHITFQNTLRETEEFNVLNYGYFYNGGGVAIGDLNNDNLPDIYLTGNMVASHLYLNQGDMRFEEIAEKAGVTAEGLWNTGVTMADVNADGWLDMYVSRSAASDPQKRRNLLFINNGDLTFTEQAEAYGIADPGYTTQAAFFDYDRDGDLDLYVLNHSVQEYAGFSRLLTQYKSRKNPYYGDKLYRNDISESSGRFTDVTAEAGILTNVLGFGLGIGIADINGDQWPDIYISNDYNEHDYLYLNQKDGTFSEEIKSYMDHLSLFSMGSDIGDINNDGRPDILTLDMLPEDHFRQKMSTGADNFDKYQRLVNTGFHRQNMRNMLQLNNGENFSEIGQLAGISNTDWSWSALFADFDLDGFQDLFVSNGYKRDYTNMDFLAFAADEQIKSQQTQKEVAVSDLLANMPPIEVPNYIYRNNGDLTFTKKTEEWGFEKILLSNGAAFGDLDNDGDPDLVINNVNAPASVYRNNREIFNQNHYLKIKLRGNSQNLSAIGAKVCITTSSSYQCQTLMPTRGFQSSVEPVLIFGLGNDTLVTKTEIIWPDGTRQSLQSTPANQTLKISYDAGKNDENNSDNQPFFTSTSLPQISDYQHIENPYNDFKFQPLIPHFLSTQGPCISKADVNYDGLEDLFIGGARGKPGQLFIQQASSTFEPVVFPFEQDAASEDIRSLFFDADGDGDPDLYVVSGGNDANAFSSSPEDFQDRLYLNDGAGNFSKADNHLPAMPVSGSSVAAADFDQDGDPDLFVGGRVMPGQYPNIPRSFLLQNDGNGRFSDITESVAPALAHPGMVTDAVWADMDADGNFELILTGEYMPVQIYSFSGGKLTNVSAPENSSGWWNTLIINDLDNDGDPDMVAGNFGWNSQIKAGPDEPVSIYASDFDHNGSIDPILAWYLEGKNYPMPWKDDLTGQLAGLKSKFIRYEDYARMTVEEIFSKEELENALTLTATHLGSAWFKNTGSNQFEINDLPVAAQLSPTYALEILDINGDGNSDIITAGNLTGTRVKFGAYDANHGTILLGDGKGNFTPVPPSKNGLDIRGEVRDMVMLSLADGRKVLIVAKNNAHPEIYELNQKPL